MSAPSLHQTAVHEIGHALMLLSCGVSDHIELSHVALAERGGITRVNIGYPTDLDRLCLAGTLEATCSLPLVLVGGFVAEQAQGYEPKMGMLDDLIRLGMTIACLSGA